MQFRGKGGWGRHTSQDEPEINLIPFIDVLLVVLIFLMLTTTFSRIKELNITLPTANANQAQPHNQMIRVAIAVDGRYAINGQVITDISTQGLVKALTDAAKGQNDSMVVLNADAMASHQSVIHAMDAARRAGLARLTFNTQTSNSAGQ